MSLKKFRNVKWDKKKDFKKSLEKFNLNNETIDLLDIVSNKNIVTVTFNSLLREKGLTYKDHLKEANLMKLYSALAIIDLIEFDKKQVMVSDIKKMIKKLNNQKFTKPEEIELVNWEEKAIKGYKFTEEEIRTLFSSNDYYVRMAEVFSAPFKDQRYYDFAYLLIMYVSIEVCFNKYNVPEDMNIFLVKLEVQQMMIDKLSYISPENFNTVIININKWFKKFDKQFYKLLARKIED